MATISKDDFITCLKKSRIVDSERLETWLNEVENESSKQVAARLVRDEFATKWQAKYLMSGRSRLDIGSYRLLERIQRDELGDRFLAVHNSLKRKVDIQVLPSTLTKDKTRLAEFMQKASLTAKLDHPNLIHVYDIDQEGGRYFLVTEHVEGKTLEAISRASLSEIDVARITSDALNGVSYAHQHDVIHGCISQSDLVLTSENQLKIQNLPLSPLRQQLAGTKSAPEPKEDFAAIADIGGSLLRDVSVSEQAGEELAKIFASLDPENADSVANAAESLTIWLGANADVTAAGPSGDDPFTGGFDGGFDQPIPTTNLVRNKTKPTSEQPEPEVEAIEPGFVGRLWRDNPVAVIATACVLGLLLIGGSTIGAMSWLNRSDAVVASNDDLAKQRGETGNTRNKPTAEEKKSQNEAGPLSRSGTANESQSPIDFNDPKMAEMVAGLANEDEKPRPVVKKDRPGKGGKQTTTKKPVVPPQKTPQAKTENVSIDVPENAVVEPATPIVAKNDAAEPAATATETAANESVPDKAAVRAPETEAPPVPDNLKEISGIGEATQSVLYKGGVTTYKQLAAMTQPEINALLEKANFKRASQKPGEWIAQAKKLSGDTSPTSTAAPDAANPSPANNAGPFEKFPRLTDLPPIEDTTEVKIADLTIKKQYLLGAEIVCEPGVSKTRLIYELNRTPADKQKWMVGVKRREKEEPTEIAIFRKSENAFHFQWLPEAAKNKFAPFLRNCFVKLTLPDDQTTFLSLRKPIKIRDLRLTPESLVNKVDIEIAAMPDPDTIVVEVLPMSIMNVETAVPNSRIERGIPGVIWLKKSDKTGFLWMQVTGEIRSKLRLQSNLMLLVQGQPTPVTNLNALDELMVVLDQQAVLSRQIHDRFKKTKEMSKSDFDKQKKEFLTDANRKQATKMKLIDYREILPKILNQPISVRVYSKLGNFQTVLAVTDSSLPQEQNKR